MSCIYERMLVCVGVCGDQDIASCIGTSLLTLSAPQDVIHVIKTRSRLRVWVGGVLFSCIFDFFFMVPCKSSIS